MNIRCHELVNQYDIVITIQHAVLVSFLCLYLPF